MAIVLIVEDEDQVRVLAESYLEQQGLKVLSAGTPTGALAILHAGINLADEAVKMLPKLKVLYTPEEQSPTE